MTISNFAKYMSSLPEEIIKDIVLNRTPMEKFLDSIKEEKPKEKTHEIKIEITLTLSSKDDKMLFDYVDKLNKLP